MHAYINTYLPTYLPTYLHTCVPTCIHAYIHTYIHAYMHTCIYTITAWWHLQISYRMPSVFRIDHPFHLTCLSQTNRWHILLQPLDWTCMHHEACCSKWPALYLSIYIYIYTCWTCFVYTCVMPSVCVGCPIDFPIYIYIHIYIYIYISTSDIF